MMSAADETYARLLAARRIVTPVEREEATKESARLELRSRITRKLATVY